MTFPGSLAILDIGKEYIFEFTDWSDYCGREITITPFFSYITTNKGQLIITDTATAGYNSFTYKYIYGETF